MRLHKTQCLPGTYCKNSGSENAQQPQSKLMQPVRSWQQIVLRIIRETYRHQIPCSAKSNRLRPSSTRKRRIHTTNSGWANQMPPKCGPPSIQAEDLGPIARGPWERKSLHCSPEEKSGADEGGAGQHEDARPYGGQDPMPCRVTL